MSQIQIDPRHLSIVKSILTQYALEVFVFGSRARGTARLLSDLDLCILGSVNKTILRRLQDDFEESDLPYKVDLVVWSELAENFQNQIKKDLIKIESA